MKQRYFPPFFLCGLVFLACLVCLTFSPAEAATAQPQPVARKAPEAKPKAKAKVTPRQSTAHLTSIEKSAPRQAAEQKNVAAKPGATKKTAALPPASENDKLKHSLDTFAKGCITTMNKQRRPGITHKEVKKQPDGTYMARYMAVDPDSLETRYKPTENKVIKYIGHMIYHEVEYVCSGKSKEQALAGPFSESNREPITELVKYKSGKWTY